MSTCIHQIIHLITATTYAVNGWSQHMKIKVSHYNFINSMYLSLLIYKFPTLCVCVCISYLLCQFSTDFYKVYISGIYMKLSRFRMKKNPEKSGIRAEIRDFLTENVLLHNSLPFLPLDVTLSIDLSGLYREPYLCEI